MFWNTFIYQIVLERFWQVWQISQQVSLYRYDVLMFILVWGFWFLKIAHRVSPYILVVSIFVWVFVFCWSTRRVSSHFITHTLTSCWCGMQCRNYCSLQNWCRRCRWRWGWRACRKTKDNEWYAARRVAFILSFCHLWWDVFSDHWSNRNFSRDLRRVFRVKELPVYLREALLSRINPILWHTLLPLLLLAPHRWL